MQGRDPEVVAILEPEFIAQKEKQIVEVVTRGEGVDSREHEVTGLELSVGHARVGLSVAMIFSRRARR
jgi:hypothetical protein